MKKRYLLLILLVLFPFISKADNVSVSVSCKSVTVGQQTSCDVTASLPGIGILAAKGSYSINGSNVSIIDVKAGSLQGGVSNGVFNLYGDTLDKVKLFTVNLNTNSVGTATLYVNVDYFGGGDLNNYPGGTWAGKINVKEPETQATTTTTQTTKQPVTGGAGRNVTQTVTQPVETTTQSLLYLTGITVDDYEVKEEDGIYYVTIDSNKESVEINATAPEGVVINGLGKRNLVYGKNTINLTLTDPSGSSKGIQVIITRPDLGDKNTLLKELEVINYKMDFDPNTMEYTITVPYNVKDVFVYAVAQSADTSIKGSGKYELTGSETNAFVTVSYGDVTASTYTIHIKKSYLGLLPIIILSIGLIGTTGGLFFLSNKLKEKDEELKNKRIANQANMARALENQGPQLSINGESATGIGARVVKPQAVQHQNIKIVEARPTNTVGIVPPKENNVETTPNPQVRIVKKVVIPSQTINTTKQVDTNTSEV